MISDSRIPPTARRGFTLIEIMVAMATGLILLNAAFALLSGTQRFIRRIEQTGMRAELMSGQVLWVMTGGTVTSYPNYVNQGSLTRGAIFDLAPARIVALASTTYQKYTPTPNTDPVVYEAHLFIPTVY